MGYKDTLIIINKILDELIEKNKKIPIVVEGEKDIKALLKLDIKGKILTLNKGVSLTNFCDNIANKYKEIIILTDWDKKGGYLCHTMKKNLQGRVKCDTYFREVLAKNSITKKVEGLPSWINSLYEKV